MTYSIAAALQAAVFDRISTDATVQTLVGSDVFDALPSGVLPVTYVLIGEEVARDKSDQTVPGAVHDFTVAVHSDAAGFSSAKAVAAAVSDALLSPDLALTRGRVVVLSFMRAQARRGQAPEGRRIDLRFRAQVEDI